MNAMRTIVAVTLSGLLGVAVAWLLLSFHWGRPTSAGTEVVIPSTEDLRRTRVLVEGRDTLPHPSAPASDHTVAKLLNRVPAGSMGELNAAFGAEGLSSSWKRRLEPQLQRQLATFISQHQGQLSNHAVECRAHTCRVYVAFNKSADGLEELIGMTAALSALAEEHIVEERTSGGLIYHRSGDGDDVATAEIFLVRSGFDGLRRGFKTPMSWIPTRGQSATSER